MELTQIRFLVDDFSKMFRFYRDVMGFTSQQNNEAGPYGKLTPPSGKTAIALQLRSQAEAQLGPLSSSGVRALIALKVDDLDATVKALTANGAKPSIATGWGMELAYVRDPEGNVLELQEWHSK